MDLVEQENMDEAEQYLKRIFSQYDPDELDAVVLGCTHYVFLKKVARSLLPGHTAVIDGNYGTARQLKRVLEEKHLLRSEGEGCVELHTSGDDEIILPRMHRLMQKIREIDN